MDTLILSVLKATAEGYITIQRRIMDGLNRNLKDFYDYLARRR